MASGRFAALAVAAFSCCSVGVWAAQQPGLPPFGAFDTNLTRTDRSRARGHARRSGDAARDAARLTNAVARRSTVQPGPVPRRNFIDQMVFERLAAAGIPHAGLRTDDEFVRRVYLDATGLPPSAADVRASSPTRPPASATA